MATEDDDFTSETRIAKGTAKKLAQNGHFIEAVEIMKSAALKSKPHPTFTYTFRWTRLEDFIDC